MSGIKLSPRLAACAEMISGDYVCDIGTDHALLPAFLVSAGICGRAIASDIAGGPLESARRTLSAMGLHDAVKVIQSDGLDSIPSGGITDVIIAGMGGELIAEIILRCSWLRSSSVKLILQPMTKSRRLRRALCENGFGIEAEHTVSEGQRTYLVIRAAYTGLKCVMPRISSHLGHLDAFRGSGRDYALQTAEHHRRIAAALPAGHSETFFEETLAERFSLAAEGIKYMTVNEIYEALDLNIPFSLMQKGDNGGLLAGSGNARVSRALIALDITCAVIEEAKRVGAELIISHHPVIYGGLYSVSSESPVGMLLRYGISAICTHSPLDLSDGGMNAIIFNMLRKPLLLCDETESFEEVFPDGRSFGRICTTQRPFDSAELAAVLKEIFGCTVVRYTKTDRPIRRIAFCSGGGKSNTTLAIRRGCDAYITGDVSHDRLIEAENSGLALFDCGHYHTENIACEYLLRLMSEACPQVEFTTAEAGGDPAYYIF